MLYIVGVDISKATFHAAIWLNGQIINLGQFPNTSEGFDQLRDRINEICPQESNIKLIMEPTGKYEQHLLFYAQKQEWLVALPNPLWVKNWAKGSGKRGKTDKIDARTLAQYGVEKNPPCYIIPSEEIEYLEDLVARRVDLEKMIRAEKNRLIQYQGTRPRGKTKLVKSLERSIAYLEKQLGQVENEIKKVYKKNPLLKKKFNLLLAVPGIGQKLVHYLLPLFAKIEAQTGRECGPKQIVAFLGLDPEPFESGKSVYKRPTISKKGNPLIRNKLYMGALGGVKGKNSPLRDFYQRLVGRGKAKKLALVAAARKIVVWAWMVFTTETPFDPEKAGAKV